MSLRLITVVSAVVMMADGVCLRGDRNFRLTVMEDFEMSLNNFVSTCAFEKVEPPTPTSEPPSQSFYHEGSLVVSKGKTVLWSACHWPKTWRDLGRMKQDDIRENLSRAYNEVYARRWRGGFRKHAMDHTRTFLAQRYGCNLLNLGELYALEKALKRLCRQFMCLPISGTTASSELAAAIDDLEDYLDDLESDEDSLIWNQP